MSAVLYVIELIPRDGDGFSCWAVGDRIARAYRGAATEWPAAEVQDRLEALRAEHEDRFRIVAREVRR